MLVSFASTGIVEGSYADYSTARNELVGQLVGLCAILHRKPLFRRVAQG